MPPRPTTNKTAAATTAKPNAVASKPEAKQPVSTETDKATVATTTITTTTTTSDGTTTTTTTTIVGALAGIEEAINIARYRKGYEARIEMAKKGIPSFKQRPWGRLYDRSTNTWSIDEEKKRQIVDIAKRYLEGENIRELASEYGSTNATIYYILRHRCGTTFPVRFKQEKLNIDETVLIQVPELLDEALRQRVIDRLDIGNDWFKSDRCNHKYLLGGRIYCGGCKNTLAGAFVMEGDIAYKVYRHGAKEAKGCFLRPKPNVPVKKIEEQVMAQLIPMFGSKIKGTSEGWDNPKNWTWEEKRKLVKMMFNEIVDGKPEGIYVKRIPARAVRGHIRERRLWGFELHYRKEKEGNGGESTKK
jgi:hypothetical protein